MTTVAENDKRIAKNTLLLYFRMLFIMVVTLFISRVVLSALGVEDFGYNPHSPYSVSKADSNHFVRAFHDTYGMTTIVTNCSNNYGPYQFPEKLIPLFINNIRHRKPLPVYGEKLNGNLPLMCRITVDGEIKQFSCKMDVPPRLWDVKNNRASGKSVEAQRISLRHRAQQGAGYIYTLSDGL